MIDLYTPAFMVLFGCTRKPPLGLLAFLVAFPARALIPRWHPPAPNLKSIGIELCFWQTLAVAVLNYIGSIALITILA